MTVKSPNLDIAHLDANADQPEVVVNAAIDAFDAKITDVVVVAFGSNTASLTQDQQAGGSLFHLTIGSPGPSGPVTLDFAAFAMGNFAVLNSTGQTATIQVSGQASPPTLANGEIAMFSSDGTTVRALSSASAGEPAAISWLIDGAGSTITTGLKGYLPIPFGCTINEVTLLGDQSGSIVVDIWKCTYAQFDSGSTHPVAGDKITASDPPTITTAKKSQDSTLAGWTTAIGVGDILAFDVTSVTSMQRVTIVLSVTKT